MGVEDRAAPPNRRRLAFNRRRLAFNRRRLAFNRRRLTFNRRRLAFNRRPLHSTHHRVPPTPPRQSVAARSPIRSGGRRNLHVPTGGDCPAKFLGGWRMGMGQHRQPHGRYQCREALEGGRGAQERRQQRVEGAFRGRSVGNIYGTALCCCLDVASCAGHICGCTYSGLRRAPQRAKGHFQDHEVGATRIVLLIVLRLWGGICYSAGAMNNGVEWHICPMVLGACGTVLVHN